MRFKRFLKKHSPEVKAILSGGMPEFFYGRRYFRDIPVFCLHSARLPDFKNLLGFLCEYGYQTLDSTELLERLEDKNYKNNGKEIVLTFDDGMASVWTIVFPLLHRYNKKVICFLLPGLIGSSTAKSKTIADDLSAEESEQLLLRDYSTNPLCSWPEIEQMHRSGLVDFQSHGMFHRRVANSSRIVDFIHPKFDPYHFGNLNVPAYVRNGALCNDPVLGHPVYRNSPMFSVEKRFEDDLRVRDACADLVAQAGGKKFFLDPQWRTKLLTRVDQTKHQSKLGDEMFVSVEDDKAAELAQSKAIIEQKLDKEVHHFCYPFFAGSATSTALAAQAGYKALHLGATIGYRVEETPGAPYSITRVQEEYLLDLPGYKGLVSTFRQKLFQSETW